MTGSAAGIWLRALDADASAGECRVIVCAGNGLRLDGRVLTALRNVVGRSGAAGIVANAEYSAQLRGNTSFANDGSGFVLLGGLTEGGAVDHNIGYGNGAYGLDVPAGIPMSLEANDWFENLLDAVHGTAPSQSDRAVDPLFCDLDANDVSLHADSPLAAAPGFEQIGALGVGCGDSPTPTLVLRFEAERLADGVAVRWRIAGSLVDAVVVERAESVAGPWRTVMAEPALEGDLFVVVERGDAGGRTRWYRLVAGPAGARRVLAGPIPVETPAAAFRLIGVTPNPATGPVRIEFSLARPASIAIQVFDLQGRTVATLARGPWPAGRHVVDGHAVKSLAPGLYLVCYAFPGGADARKLLRAR